jgi:plastocyanin
MRRLLLGACATVALLAAPAWGATTDVDVANFAFTPANITVQQGDSVTWHFNGTSAFDLRHSVTADRGQADSWDSDPGNGSPLHATGDTFSHTFNTAGTFIYHCKVHASMEGHVTVRAPGGGPAPDTTAPKLSGLKVTGGRACHKKGRKCKKRSTRITFTAGEGGRYKATFKRTTGRSPKAAQGVLTQGRNVLTLSTKRLPPARYTLSLVGTDAAGNASQPATAKFRVR